MSNPSPYTPSTSVAAPASNSTPSNQELPKKGVRWWLILKIFAIPFIVIWAIVFMFRIGWTIRDNMGRNAMVSEIQKLNEDGFSVGNETSANRYLERTSQQNTEAWLQVFGACESDSFVASVTGVPALDRKVEIDEFADDFDTSIDWQFAEVCKRFTAEQTDLVEQIRSLASADQPVYFPIQFQSMQTLLPEVQSIRTVAWVIRIDAQVAIHLQDAERASRDILTLMSLSRTADAVPFTVSKLVGVAIRRMAMRALQDAIKVDLFSEQQLLEIDRVIEKNGDIGERWSVMMGDEMALSLLVFETPDLTMKAKKPIPARGHDAVYYIDLMRKAIEIPSDDWRVLFDLSLELESKLLSDTKSFPKQVDLILTGLLAPSFNAIATALINDSQLHRQARVAIAIRLYSRRHKELPSNLAMLPEELSALKPFGGLPFGYTIADRRSALWGFDVSNKQQQTPASLPITNQPNVDALRNRELVWWFYEKDSAR